MYQGILRLLGEFCSAELLASSSGGPLGMALERSRDVQIRKRSGLAAMMTDNKDRSVKCTINIMKVLRMKEDSI